ncbi:uncharacterized mitochondrial protein AtMg00810-like [Hibiscus syriacus]|uniref:uncharacterized mitochondrial protein AtMg00810-like n=1 Tax=Hibiscus syriacus TaxID=106335 RepID=UPI0019226ACB|nr:uncharacterized mitochondrial protein AtMg00810-like [Hibiscus syriacus]
MQRPKQSHLEAALKVVRYVKKEPTLGILLKASGDNQIKAYCDADWAGCLMTMKSIIQFCIKLGDYLVSWKSKKQCTVARSSAEAKYRGMTAVAAEITWLRGLLTEIGVENVKPAKLYCGIKVALQISANPIFHERTQSILK